MWIRLEEGLVGAAGSLETSEFKGIGGTWLNRTANQRSSQFQTGSPLVGAASV